MRFLLHSSLSTYNSVTKKWVFSLDKRISNPTSVRVVKATYSTPGDTSPHPGVVYLRSDALASMIPQKHTLELRALNHENASNVVSVLSETHCRGRFRIHGGPRYPVDPNSSVRELDIFFTDGDTVLDGAAGSGGGTATGSDAEIVALGDDLLAWFDMDGARTLDATFSPATTAGDDVSYLYNRSPGAATLVFANQYGSEMQLANVGETRGVTRNGSWQSMADTSTPTGDLEQEFTVHSLMIAPPAIGDFSYLFDLHMLKCFTWDAGAIAFKNLSGSNTTVNVSLIPSRAYIISVQRRVGTDDHDGDGSFDPYEFVWRIEDLVTEVVVTDITQSGNVHPGVEKIWRIGSASTHFSHVQGPFIVHNGVDADHQATCQTWLRNKFAGTATAEESENGIAEDAAFFVELDVGTQ